MSTIKHGTNYGYSKQGCRCDDCRKAANERQNRYREANRDKRNSAARARYYENNKHKVKSLPSVPLAKLVQAERLLKDGASRAEAARTVGVSVETLERWFPDLKWTNVQKGKHVRVLNMYRDKI